MGSFNVNGFYSHLPIEYGDEIGVVVCAQVKDSHINLALEPTVNLYPIMAPIYGKYGDSFTIDDIDRDSYTAKLFEQFCRITIFVNVIDCKTISVFSIYRSHYRIQIDCRFKSKINV